MSGRHRARSRPPLALAVAAGAAIGALVSYQSPVPVVADQTIVAVAVLGQPPPQPSRALVIKAALSKIGRPYVWGAKGEHDTFDCSGLTEYAWRQAGVEIGPSTFDQVKVGTPAQSPQPGDLIFSNWNARGPNHVALAVSDREIIEAPGRGMVVRKTAMPKSYVVRRVNP